MSGQIVLVTGGNNGIGLEACATIASRPGNKVLMASRSIEKGTKALASLGERVPAGSIEVVELDITSDESISAAVKQVTDKYGRVDTLINNAGICPTDNGNRNDYRQAFDTNATSSALNTRAFVPLLRKSQSPRVVYVSSALGSISARVDPSVRSHNEDYKVYRMSKAAVNMLAVCDAWEYKDDGIRVFHYCPGFVVSDLAGMREAKEKLGAPGPEKSAQGLLAIHEGKQDENAGKFIHSRSVMDGEPLFRW